jgi:endonuclease YncB( thermonuclease family)
VLGEHHFGRHKQAAKRNGRVKCARVDANAEQVRRGMAWVFVKYAPARSHAEIVRADDTAALKIAAYEEIWRGAAVVV